MRSAIAIAAIALGVAGLAARSPEPTAGDLPNSRLTPGEVASASPICGSTRELRQWTRERDNRILAEYGLPPGQHPTFEVDHLVALCLGGADTDNNLWAEHRGGAWGAERKDRVEWKACYIACLDPSRTAELQKRMAKDWTSLAREILP